MADACIYVEFEPNDFESETLRRAAKEHKCGECGDTIEVGDLYEYASGKTEDWFWTAKTCARCVNVRTDYFQTWFYGEMVELFMDAHGVDYREGIPPHITPCRSPAPPLMEGEER